MSDAEPNTAPERPQTLTFDVDLADDFDDLCTLWEQLKPAATPPDVEVMTKIRDRFTALRHD